MAGLPTLEALPSEDTTLRTTRPLPVEGATGGLGACLLDGLNAEVETGLLKLKAHKFFNKAQVFVRILLTFLCDVLASFQGVAVRPFDLGHLHL